MTPYFKFFWKELTDDGTFIDPDWANKDGYETEEFATVHFFMMFNVDPVAKPTAGPCFRLMKLYGLK